MRWIGRVIALGAGLVAVLMTISGLWVAPATAARTSARGESLTFTVKDLDVLAISKALDGESFPDAVRSYMCASSLEPLLKEVGATSGAAIYRVTLSDREVVTIKHATRNCASSIKEDYGRSIRWWVQFVSQPATLPTATP